MHTRRLFRFRQSQRTTRLLHPAQLDNISHTESITTTGSTSKHHPSEAHASLHVCCAPQRTIFEVTHSVALRTLPHTTHEAFVSTPLLHLTLIQTSTLHFHNTHIASILSLLVITSPSSLWLTSRMLKYGSLETREQRKVLALLCL